MKKNYPQEYRRSSNKNCKEIASHMIASQKKVKEEIQGFRKVITKLQKKLQMEIDTEEKVKIKKRLNNMKSNRTNRINMNQRDTCYLARGKLIGPHRKKY